MFQSSFSLNNRKIKTNEYWCIDLFETIKNKNLKAN